MQYWLGGTDENIESMLRFLISRYSRVEGWRCKTEMPKEYPDVGLYHPIKRKIVDIIEDLPKLVPRRDNWYSFDAIVCLEGDTAHYDAVIKRFAEHNIQAIPLFPVDWMGQPSKNILKIPKSRQLMDFYR